MKQRKNNRAFTLAEVILAIGIMGVGMVFTACLFPVAIKESESSSAAMEGLIIAQNGLDVAKQMLHTSGTSNVEANTPNKTVGNFVWIDGDNSEYTAIADLPNNSALGLSAYYAPTTDWNATPAPTEIPNIGCVVLLRQHDTSSNEYILISVSYRKRKTGSTIKAESVSFPIGSMENTVTVGSTSEAKKFVKNGILIVDSSDETLAGKMARILGRDNNKITINHPLTNGGSISNAIVIYEDDSGNVLQETPILSATSAIVTIN